MHANPTPAAPATSRCSSCSGDGVIRVVTPDGGRDLCVLHGMALLALAEDGVSVAVVVDADLACPWCGAGSGHFPGCRGGR